ncbi:hypothetical protein CK203_103786 [Vitis vinifera]|uniref:Retrovirus-related Pol polyprotein from transposon 17.6 n=1 Tax=Vitis vinifera TaxID=29760 RepID=A0A438CI46_VITVI|nr:hypothetical protein CK203_103786 [Vitis vinifera]
MEEEAKPVRQPQRRLNPHMQEVVRAEVLKLLQAGIIYPISDSPWVSPTQVVPKKSGITVVQNDKGEKFLHASLQAIHSTISWMATPGIFKLKLLLKIRRRPLSLVHSELMHTEECLSAYAMHQQHSKDAFNLEAVLNRCIEKDLVLTGRNAISWYPKDRPWAYYLSQGIEVDKAKVELIVKLPSPTTVKGVRQFLGHVGSIGVIATTAPIVRAPNWQLPFEVMCDASDFAIGAVLGQREDGKPYVIYYASKTSFIVVFTDHSALKYLLTKQDAKARLIRWILLLQEFNLQIKDKKGVENVVADHLSRLAIAHNSHILPINDDFPEESLMLIEVTP